MQEVFNEIKEYAKINFVPIVRPETSEYLINAVKSENIKKILEIGTAIGYSAGLMLESNKNARLISIEKNENSASIAKENLSKLGVSSRAEIICADAKDALEMLVERKEKFDFVFLDGPKGQYFHYLENIKKLFNKGAIIFADNIYFGGMVKTGIYPHRKKTIIVSLTSYLEEMHSENFDSQEYDIEDGFCISKYLK